jgi:hypothetical protein
VAGTPNHPSRTPRKNSGAGPLRPRGH